MEAKKARNFLIYPVIYGIYTAIRGSYTDWYPYPFTNPNIMGSFLNVLLAYLVMCFVYYWLARLVLGVNNKLAEEGAEKLCPKILFSSSCFVITKREISKPCLVTARSRSLFLISSSKVGFLLSK